jgi:uncharacterized protein YjbJ (UPF0337 family)
LAPGVTEQLEGKAKAQIGQGQARLAEHTGHPEMARAGRKLEAEGKVEEIVGRVKAAAAETTSTSRRQQRGCRARQGDWRTHLGSTEALVYVVRAHVSKKLSLELPESVRPAEAATLRIHVSGGPLTRRHSAPTTPCPGP